MVGPPLTSLPHQASTSTPTLSNSPFTSCREVSGDSCRVTGCMGQPPAKMSWRQGWGQERTVGAWASHQL